MIKIPLRKAVLNYLLECNGSWGLFQQIQFKMYSKVNPDSNQHGGELVASVLQAHGVKYLFTLIGGHISPVVVAAQNVGIRVIDTRHEATAVFAADAVARLSGAVGVAAVTAGPGLTNTITAVKNAQMAESPVLLMGGAAATLLKGRGSLQDIDQLSLFKSLCKYSASIKCIRDIVPTVRKALQVAQSGTPGPVFVEFPIDVLYPYNLVKRELGSRKEGKTISQKVINWYMDRHMHNLFAGAFEPRDTKPLPVEVPLATSVQVTRCVDLLSKAKKPLILLGSQALLPSTTADNLRKALETLGIPCFLGGMARGLLGRNSPLHMRQKRKEALKDADVVVLAGAVCDFRLSYGQVLNRKSKIIAVNRSKEQLFKNSDIFWKPTVAIQANVSDFVIQLAEHLKDYSCDKEWLKSLQERDDEKEEQNRLMAEQIPENHLNPLKVLYDLEETMADNTILVADGGDFVASAAYILRARGPLKWLDPGAFGTLGVGAGFALGAKLCNPDSDVVIVYGDGSLGYSLIEFDTFVRHKLPIVAVVGNDACWTQISREQVPLFKSNVACDLAFSNYHSAVEGLGAKGILIKAEDRDQVTSMLKNALDRSRQGETVLVNALIGKTAFRSGSISV